MLFRSSLAKVPKARSFAARTNFAQTSCDDKAHHHVENIHKSELPCDSVIFLSERTGIWSHSSFLRVEQRIEQHVLLRKLHPKNNLRVSFHRWSHIFQTTTFSYWAAHTNRSFTELFYYRFVRKHQVGPHFRSSLLKRVGKKLPVFDVLLRQ